VKGALAIPAMLEAGYTVVFAVDRQVLLEDTRPISPQGPISTFVEKRGTVDDSSTIVRLDESSTRLDALVLGGADCVWADVAALEAMLGREWDGVVIAANDIGCHWPRRLDAWCTLHPEKMPKWLKERSARGHPDGYITWSRKGGRADRQIKTWGGGASGMLAVAVAYEMGCERVILAGVPMTRTAHFVESGVHQRGKIWSSASTHLKAWRVPVILARMRGRVKSMSGETRALLGYPDATFLRLDNVEAA
jgi:hypothetical protein